MVEDDSSRQDGGIESLVAALRRAKREVGFVVECAVAGIENWVDDQWFPIQLVLAGGLSWVLSQTFGWLLGEVIKFGSWLVMSLLEVSVLASNGRILIGFFVAYAIHSVIQTKLILVIKTKVGRMDSDVRADGGGNEEFSSRLATLGGILIGITIGSAFGMDGIFVGAGMGWVLGNEIDNRLEAKVNETGRPRKEKLVENQ